MRTLLLALCLALASCGETIVQERVSPDSSEVCIVGETSECCIKDGVKVCEGTPE